MRLMTLSGSRIRQTAQLCLAAVPVAAAASSTMAAGIAPYDEGRPLFDPRIPGEFDGSRDGYGPGVQAAADHIISFQCDDGGWGWPHEPCPTTTYNNITSPIALGLLKAYSITGDADTLAAAIAGGDFDLTSEYGNGEARFSSFSAYFMWNLTAASGDATYSSFAETEFFDELTAGTYGPDDLDTAGWIAAVEAARTGTWINLRPWEFHTIIPAADAIGNAGQAALFEQAVLDGLNTLDNTDPDNVYSDLVGLAGGVRGLAFAGTTTFTPLTSPNHMGIVGISTLCGLADQLASYQNPDGSWYWHSNLDTPGESDKDTQTTAYAVLALIEAQSEGCGPYDVEIARARAWLDTMQDTDGGYFSYPGGGKNTTVIGEALNAAAIGNLSLTSVACEATTTLTVEIDMAQMPTEIVGGQFFLEYDDSVLDVVSVVPGDPPFDLEVSEDISTPGLIDYAVGVTGGGPGTDSPTTMAVITFDVLTEVCDESGLVAFRSHMPPTRLTDAFGNPILPTHVDLSTITLDQTAPVITCPDDITVNADAGGCTATLDFTEPFDSPVPTCSTQSPDCWYPDRYPPFAFEQYDFSGENVLLHSISTDDSYGNRPGGYQSTFYNYQGRKYDTWIPVPTTLRAAVYIPADWEDDARHASMWATVFSSSDTITGYPIIGFTSSDPDDPFNPDPAPADVEARFRAWMDEGSGGWVDLGLPSDFAYGAWYTLEVEITHTEYVYRVISDSDTLTFTYPKTLTVASVGNIMLQAYNFSDATYPVGDSYDVLWDNVVLGPEGPVATDNCSVATIVGTRSDSQPLDDPYPQGTTTITWTATDECGNFETCTQDVIVSGDNEMIVDLAYDGPLDASVERCITFEFTGVDSATVEQVVLFNASGAVDDVSVLVPCGDYDCVTVRDRLHSLASSVSVTLNGPLYEASVTGGDAMLGGNLNDDLFIDILDFGTLVGQWNQSLPPDTDCTTAAPHSDITGDGLVSTADFSSIQINFLEMSDSGCSPLPIRAGAPGWDNGPAPVTRISVERLEQLGWDHMIAADLNGDGWVDTRDMTAFWEGARP